MNSYTLKVLAEKTNSELVGDASTIISGLCSLESGKKDSVTFLANSHYKKFLPDTKAGAVIISPDMLEYCQTNALVNKNPYLTYALISQLFAKKTVPKSGVHTSAVIGENCSIDKTAAISANVVIGNNVKIGANSYIAPGCFIGDNVIIGDNCFFNANTVVYYGCKLGNSVLTHSGVVIGSDGFGMAPSNDGWQKIEQLGIVEVGSNVEIGANSTIDRGAIENTVIGNGVKLDNQVQIGHNVVIGDHTVIAGCTAVAGSAKIGRWCMIGGQCAIAGHIEIADKTTVTGQSGIGKTITKPGTIYSSSIIAQEYNEWRRTHARFQMLEKLAKKIKSLEKKLDNHMSELNG